jgi:hypothetical protein
MRKNKPKRMSAAQRALIDLALTPADGFEVDVIQQAEPFSGVTAALRCAASMAQDEDVQARVIVGEADTAFAAVRQLCRTIGGFSCPDTTQRLSSIMRILAHNGPGGKYRPVCIVFDEARNFKPRDTMKLLHCCDAEAQRMQLDLRVMFILGKIARYTQAPRRGYHEADYPAFWLDDASRKLFSPHVRVWTYTPKTLIEQKPARKWEATLTQAATPLMDQLEAVESPRIVKTA